VSDFYNMGTYNYWNWLQSTTWKQ